MDGEVKRVTENMAEWCEKGRRVKDMVQFIRDMYVAANSNDNKGI